MTFLPSRLLAVLALLAGLGCASLPGTTHAAHSYDSCTGFIDSLPATISTQGTWCLRAHLSTNISDGYAINIAANNVTLDCNDFRIGGLAAGDNSLATGINSANRQNTTVRRCNVRGFHSGISISRGAGHLVEDNRLDNNLRDGIRVLNSENSIVRRNQVSDTGGGSIGTVSYGIRATADVIDNMVTGVFPPSGPNGSVYGISLAGAAFVVRDNRVRGLLPGSDPGTAFGIFVTARDAVIDRNHVAVPDETSGSGIRITSGRVACSRNVISGFNHGIQNCVRDTELRRCGGKYGPVATDGHDPVGVRYGS